MLHWPLHKLEDLTENGRQITYGVVKPGPEDPAGGVKFVRGGDIYEGRILIENLRTITADVSRPYRRTLLKGGELVVSLVGNPGHVAIVPGSLAGANLARQAGLVALRPDVDAHFVKYFLMSPLGRAELFSQMTGSVQIVINLANLRGVRVPLPSLPIQRRIAGILSAYDDLIENSQRRIKILEEMARRLYREWFVHFRFPGHEGCRFVESPLGEIPEGWEVKRLGQVVELNYGKALKKEERCDGPFPVFGSSGQVGTHESSLTKGPGIVVGRKGNVGSVFWCEDDFFVIDTAYFVTSALPLRFLYYVLPTLNFINSDAAVPGLSRNQAYGLEIIVPPVALLESFCELADVFEGHALLLTKQIQNLRCARDLLLPRLLSGQIDVEALPEPVLSEV